MRPHPRWCEWLFALLLYSPVAFFYSAHYGAELLDPDHIGTGFIQYDQPSYMASAREYIDGSSAGLLYALPRDPDHDAEPTLVQVHLWALSLAWRITGMDPGLLFVLYGAIFGVLAIRVFLALFDACVPAEGMVRRWGQLLFVWGGGVLCLVGMARGFVLGARGADLLRQSFELDPAGGWWFLNLGRNLVYPNEAYYHFMFFAALLLMVRRRFLAAALISVVLAWSHPFAGVGLLATAICWTMTERFYVRSGIVPAWSIGALLITAASCAYYFFIWVPRHADSELVASLRDDWTVSAQAFIPAYALVGAMTLLRMRTPARTVEHLSVPQHRLLLVMAVVNFLLENHEFAITPHQPVHFTRGYVWSALFLLGTPWLLNEAWPWVRTRWKKAGVAIAVGFTLFFCLDNLLFMSMQTRGQLLGTAASYWMSRDAKDALTKLNELHQDRELLVSQDLDLAHLAQVHTPYRTYAAHFFGPEERDKVLPHQLAFFHSGEMSDPRLAGPLMVVAMTDSGGFVPPGHAKLLHANTHYRIFRVDGP